MDVSYFESIPLLLAGVLSRGSPIMLKKNLLFLLQFPHIELLVEVKMIIEDKLLRGRVILELVALKRRR